MDNSMEQIQEDTTSTIINTTSNDIASSVMEEAAVKQEQPMVLKSTTVEETYPIKDLIDNCKALGYDRVIVSGALFGCEEKELTKSKFIEKVKKFLGKKVE